MMRTKTTRGIGTSQRKQRKHSTQRFVTALLALLVMIWAPALADSLDDRGAAPDYHDVVSKDGPVFMANAPDGRLWAVWSYASGLETDIAISTAIGETWSLPELVGRFNELDDLDPRIAFFPDGRPLLVWWQKPEQGSSQVVYSVHVQGRWSKPQRLAPDSASNPNLFVLPDGKIQVGYVDVSGSISWQLLGQPGSTNGATNGPDPMPTRGKGIEVILRPRR